MVSELVIPRTVIQQHAKKVSGVVVSFGQNATRFGSSHEFRPKDVFGSGSRVARPPRTGGPTHYSVTDSGKILVDLMGIASSSSNNPQLVRLFIKLDAEDLKEAVLTFGSDDAGYGYQEVWSVVTNKIVIRPNTTEFFIPLHHVQYVSVVNEAARIALSSELKDTHWSIQPKVHDGRMRIVFKRTDVHHEDKYHKHKQHLKHKLHDYRGSNISHNGYPSIPAQLAHRQLSLNAAQGLLNLGYNDRLNRFVNHVHDWHLQTPTPTPSPSPSPSPAAPRFFGGTRVQDNNQEYHRYGEAAVNTSRGMSRAERAAARQARKNNNMPGPSKKHHKKR